MKILNTFTSQKDDLKYYPEHLIKKPLYENGEYKIIRLTGSHLYTFRDVAINELVGINKEHVNSLAKDERPSDKNSQAQFLFDRAKETLQKAIDLRAIEVKKYKVSFVGRTKGAIGITYKIAETVKMPEGSSKEQIILKLYDKYELIGQVSIPNL